MNSERVKPSKIYHSNQISHHLKSRLPRPAALLEKKSQLVDKMGKDKKGLLLYKIDDDNTKKRRKRRRHQYGTWCSLVCFIFVGAQYFVHFYLPTYSSSKLAESGHASLASPDSEKSQPQVSLVILTYKRFDLFSLLLQSILQQKGRHSFEILIADSGCIPETKKEIKKYLDDPIYNFDGIPYKYLEACDNPGYAIGNNRAVKELASESSKWLLFLNDDITMQGDDFLENMMKVVESHPEEAAGSGCVMKNSDGSKLIESGSILFKDASAHGFGRDRTDFNAPELSYPRPVDYVSGACLLVAKKIFTDYDGFDAASFPSYYEDTDLQTHIQHDLGKQLWLSPKSIAHHAEHASFGSSTATQLMNASKNRFVEKWKYHLVDHLSNPFANKTLTKTEREVALLRASDLRARDPERANILWLDTKIPNRNKGGEQAFGNIKVLLELGHRVTVATTKGNWCSEDCIDELRNMGVEVATTDDWENDWEIFVESRQGFYDVFIVSRPDTFKQSNEKWQHYLKKHPSTIVYDSEALVYRDLNLHLDRSHGRT